MPVRTTVPRTTHTWMKPLYDYVDDAISLVYPSGASGAANGAVFGGALDVLQFGKSTSQIGLYGSTGIARIATGTAGVFASATSFGASGFGATGLGESGFYEYFGRAAVNGGSGSYHTLGDAIIALKNLGALPQ